MDDLSDVPRVLVVEDDGLIALDIETTLLDAGVAEIVSVATVEDGLLAVEESSFAAAVLDLHLGRNGWTYDIARRLKEKGIPFVLSSGTMEVGGDFSDVPLVLKPFSSEQLVAALIDLLSGRATQAAQ